MSGLQVADVVFFAACEAAGVAVSVCCFIAHQLAEPQVDLLHCLRRSQYLGNDAGARFVGTVVLAIAVMALDVARRRNSHMHTGEIVMRLLGIAGVVMHLGADMLRQMAELVVAGTTGVGIAAAAGLGN